MLAINRLCRGCYVSFFMKRAFQVAGDSYLAREENAHEGAVGLHASDQEQQVSANAQGSA